MPHIQRYGRRIPVPSTVQIRHELRVSADQDIRARCAGEDGLAATASWEDIVAHRAELAAAWI